ncbi:glutathione S-transferase family protein [Endozoicomonas sp. YOMI1]|uniref:glutathione S-transferase family protein n=1 Tax=Endozoicomonas sp. YOMI1 TaxID=2828739 RepID=UPI002148DE2F|nr:glutathione S-transferase family protein [Endozoicomonas sp. YOMI1]
MSKLYGVPLSPMVRKVLLALEIKQIDHELVPVTPFMKPEGFEKISPLKKIPAWEDNKVTLADSTVICEYLEDRYPEQALYPKMPEEKAKARWFEEYADTVMLPVLGTAFFERVAKKLINQPADEVKVQEILQTKLPQICVYLESQVPETDFLFGGDLQLADIALATHFINLAHAGVQIESVEYPVLSAYIDRLFQHPAVAHRIAEDKKVFGGK